MRDKFLKENLLSKTLSNTLERHQNAIIDILKETNRIEEEIVVFIRWTGEEDLALKVYYIKDSSNLIPIFEFILEDNSESMIKGMVELHIVLSHMIRVSVNDFS